MESSKFGCRVFCPVPFCIHVAGWTYWNSVFYCMQAGIFQSNPRPLDHFENLYLGLRRTFIGADNFTIVKMAVN